MPSFEFNKKTRTYFKDGRPVKPATLRLWAAEVLERTREQMSKVTADYVEGAINRPAWFLEMKSLVSRSHSAIWMLAQGGKDAMSSQAWGAAANRVKGEVGYLRGFERDLANGQAGTEAQIAARASLYANGLRATYENAIIHREKSAGATRVLRVLGEPLTSHCSDCPALAGEYDVDSVPAIGEGSECGSACNCSIESVEALEAA